MPPPGAGAIAWTSSSSVSKNTGRVPVGVDPVDLAFVAAADVHRAVRRADHRPQERRAGLVDGGRRSGRASGGRRSRSRGSRPRRAGTRLSVETCQNVGQRSVTASGRSTTAAQRGATRRSSRVHSSSGSVSVREPVTAMPGRDFPFAEQRALQRTEAAAVAIGFHHRQHRRRQRRQRLALDDGAAVAGDEADVEAVVLARAVEHPHHLRQAARLQRLHLQLARLPLRQPRRRRPPSSTRCRERSAESGPAPSW